MLRCTQASVVRQRVIDRLAEPVKVKLTNHQSRAVRYSTIADRS